MVVPTLDIRAERIFAGMTARTMPAIVTKRDGLGESNVEAECARDCRCNLCDFECVGETGALMVVGKDKNLRFAGEPTKRGGMQNAVTIAFETGTEWIGLFGCGARACPDGSRCAGGKEGVFVVLALVKDADSFASP